MDANDPAYSGTYPWAAERADLLARIAELESERDLFFNSWQVVQLARDELEAQAAVLAEKLSVVILHVNDAAETFQCLRCGSMAEKPRSVRHGEKCDVWLLLANLPQAVQRHLEKDWALFDFVKSIATLDDEDMNIYNINQTALNVRKWAKEALTAYRTIGWEE